MAHAVLGAVVAQASGNNALTGATGAGLAARSTGMIAKALYGTEDFSTLSEEQKQTVSVLTTLASGLVVGNTASAIAGGQAGKNTAENNDMRLPVPVATDYLNHQMSRAMEMTKQGATSQEISQALAKGAAAITGYLAPGRGVWANVGLNMGSALAVDGLNPASIGGAATGSLAGGVFGKYAPVLAEKTIGNSLPGIVYDIGSSFTHEYGNDAIKELIKKVGNNDD